MTIGALGGILVLSGLAFGPRTALFGTRSITRAMDRCYFVLGYVCGVELLLLGFFITLPSGGPANSTGRRLRARM